ncbi:MAG TPA: oxidoreductase C-terminal domain-containing protein, partial [Solirubrobacterales bacterium]|nr:oxidoreductase C-terminal domain-containing protein [Solirubrobacterales bacterium]
AARAMLGETEPYEVVPYFFSDLADWAGLEYVGPASEWDETIWRGDPDAGEFSVFYVSGGKVAGALSVGRSEDLGYARELLAKGTDVSGRVEVLADESASLDSLL